MSRYLFGIGIDAKISGIGIDIFDFLVSVSVSMVQVSVSVSTFLWKLVSTSIDTKFDTIKHIYTRDFTFKTTDFKSDKARILRV